MEGKVIVITKIEIKNVPEDHVRVVMHQNEKLLGINPAEYHRQVDLAEEEIRGEKFVNNNGEIICIGMSKQVQEAIGLPMEVFRKLSEHNSHLFERNTRLSRENEKISVDYDALLSVNKAIFSAGFFKRLQFLFTKRI